MRADLRPFPRSYIHHFVVTMAWTEEYSCKEKDPGLIILYKDSAIIHHALELQGAPVLQGPNPQASGEAFKAYVYNQLVSGVPDKLVNCVEDAHNTSGPLVEYFPCLFHRLPGKTFMNLILRMKALFPPTDPWVQALPGPLATVFEVRGGMVEMVAQVFIHGPFRYP